MLSSPAFVAVVAQHSPLLFAVFRGYSGVGGGGADAALPRAQLRALAGEAGMLSAIRFVPADVDAVYDRITGGGGGGGGGGARGLSFAQFIAALVMFSNITCAVAGAGGERCCVLA